MLRHKITSLVFLFILSISLVSDVSAHWPVAQHSHVSFIHRNNIAIDIAAPCRSLVYPVLDGTVVFAGWKNNGGGWQVWVSHGSGRYTGYYHMFSQPRVVRGTHVHYNRGYKAGAVLGYVGSTGISTGCHLHLEYWHGYPWGAGSWRSNSWQLIDHGYWYYR